MKSRTFLESTRIYHFPFFCYLMESGSETFVINPFVTHSIKNFGIRKVKNDKLDFIDIVKLGLKPELQVSVMPVRLVLELRALSRNYYGLVDIRSTYVNQLKTQLHTVFPQYLDIFCDGTGTTSMMILEEYPTPDKLLLAVLCLQLHWPAFVRNVSEKLLILIYMNTIRKKRVTFIAKILF